MTNERNGLNHPTMIYDPFKAEESRRVAKHKATCLKNKLKRKKRK